MKQTSWHTVLLRKKILRKRENGFTMKTQKYQHHLMDCAMRQSTHQFHKILSYLKMFSMQCRKRITVEDNKKRMNIVNFINIYTQIYIPILYVTRMSQNTNDSINSTLQHSRVAENNCCVLFPTSRFPYLILLAIRIKNN